MKTSLSLLTCSFLFATTTLADDGLWHPSGAAGAPQYTNTWVAATTAAVQQPPTASGATGGDWQSAVTWPAGCENWSNPCPSGAKIAGGGVAGGKTEAGAVTTTAPYKNDFTSYTTMTDSRGVITGMPSVATVAAGVDSSSTLSTAVRSSNLTSTRTSSSTRAGFSQSTTGTPIFPNAASSKTAVGATWLIGAIGMIMVML